MLFQSFAAIGVGIILGFVYSWQMALFMLGLVPLFFLAAMIQMKFTKGFSAGRNEILEEAGKVNSYLTVEVSTVYFLKLT